MDTEAAEADGCWQYRPTFDGYGNPLGQSWVNLC